VGAPLRFYLTGRVGIEASHRRVDQRDLHGPQGRLALVHLVSERRRPVAVDRLAAAVWGEELPPSWEPSLRALVSKLRRVLAELDPALSLASDAGCYQLLGEAWVDVEVAVNAVDRAEGAVRRGDRGQAWSEATVASGIAARPVLEGEDLPWIVALRERLTATHSRALTVLAQVYLEDGQLPLAVAVARQLVALEPYRESGHRTLMRAHLAAGDRGEAVRVYAALRSRLRDDLGVDPSEETQRLHLEALRTGRRDVG
jgi:SARP family transcriptional regulator, regulator of embCAB operon